MPRLGLGAFAARGKERDGSAEFGSNLSRRLQSDGAPLLGPEHRQVGQALEAEPARKPTLHRVCQPLGVSDRACPLWRLTLPRISSRLAFIRS